MCPPPPPPPASRLSSVSTMLTLYERSRIDAVGEGQIATVHRDSIHEVLRDVRERRARAVVVSVARCRPDESRQVARMVRDYPSVRTVALLTDAGAQAPHAVLSLGQSGVRHLIDARRPGGWQALREALLQDDSADVLRRAAALVARDLASTGLITRFDALQGEPTEEVDEAWRFFDTLFSLPVTTTTVTELARAFGAALTTFMSRFHRIALPQPKRYLDMTRLMRAAALFESHTLSLRHVAFSLYYSSPQALARSIESTLGVKSLVFRNEYDGATMVDVFRQRLVLPYLHAYPRFPP